MSSEDFPTSPSPKYIPFSEEHESIVSCGAPVDLNLKSLFKDSTIVIASVPFAFSPTCTEEHIPDYIKHIDQFKSEGVDKIIVLSASDPFAMSAWGKALGVKDPANYIIFAHDVDLGIAKALGSDYIADLSKGGLGVRSQRYAGIIENGEIKYLESENELNFTEISSAETLLKRL
ncbi:unnamed protein product [Candida verbasci]|uniref:Thioredoxin domain-containing protein n=1 Tax=Candida verbasci TaxID=1227364 RepID=A0A9W4TZC9_9ASCO|nr:unnamed protein product [Candida verbasci]